MEKPDRQLLRLFAAGEIYKVEIGQHNQGGLTRCEITCVGATLTGPWKDYSPYINLSPEPGKPIHIHEQHRKAVVAYHASLVSS